MRIDRPHGGVGARLRERWGDQRGVSLVLVAGAAVALFSIVALAVDYGMLTSARTEAQRVADLSALAGAGVLASFPGQQELARAEAIGYAARNTIRGTPAAVLPEDVVVDLAEQTVEVTVYRTAERGNPMATWFARVFGIDAVDVSARAKAEASDVGEEYEVNCLLPLALPDRWREADGSWPEINDTFDPAEGDVYDVETTGYDGTAIGAQVYMRSAGGGGGDFNPSWYFPWTPIEFADDLYDNSGPGADRYRSRFTSCVFGAFAPGDLVWTEPGAMVGPTNFGFDALYDLDPTAFWDSSNGGCVARPGEGCVAHSYRMRAVPLFDPTQPPDVGRNEFVISNFALLFYEGRQGNRYVGRFLGLTAYDASNSGGNDSGAGPLAKQIRLIE